jgi:hypothetical protein
LLNLVRRAFRVAVVYFVVPVVLEKPPQQHAHQLVLEHDAFDVGAALVKALLGPLVGAVHLQVVLALTRADEARVEGLAGAGMRVPVALQKAAARVRQRDGVVAVSGHASGLDQALPTEVAKVA